LQVCIRVIAEYTHTKGDIRSEPEVRIAGNKFVKIEIPLQGKFPDIAVEAEVAAALIVVIRVINIRVSYLRKMAI
jgi:hypothetical protein